MDNHLSDSHSALRYVFDVKHGLKSDFTNDHSTKLYDNFARTGIIRLCARHNGTKAWKLTSSGYNTAAALFTRPQYTFFERLHNSLNHWLMRHERRREREASQSKEEYFRTNIQLPTI